MTEPEREALSTHTADALAELVSAMGELIEAARAVIDIYPQFEKSMRLETDALGAALAKIDKLMGIKE